MGKNDRLDKAYENIRFRTVSKSNKGSYYVDRVCWINEDQFNQFVKMGIISRDMVFDTKLFKELKFRAQFRADYEMALKSLGETGKLPDGTTPPKEIKQEDLTWNKTLLDK